MSKKQIDISYDYPEANIQYLAATNSRDTAVNYMQRGFELFTVPQMFGEEEGVIVLYLAEQDQSHPANQMSRESALRALEDYEIASRKLHKS